MDSLRNAKWMILIITVDFNCFEFYSIKINVLKTSSSVLISIELYAGLSPAATDLLQALLRPDPLQRLTPTQTLEHPWANQLNVEMQYRMQSKNVFFSIFLIFDPN